MKKLAFLVAIPYVFAAYAVFVQFSDSEFLGSLARVVGIPAVVFWGISIVASGQVRRPNSFHTLFLLFIGWSMASWFWSVDPVSTVAKCYRFALFFGLTLMLWDLTRYRYQLNMAIQTLVFAGYFMAASLFYNYSQGQVSLMDRYSALGIHPNDLPRLFGIIMPLSWMLVFDYPSKGITLRVLNLAFPIVATVAMLLTASRGGLVSCFPAFIYLGYMTFRFHPGWRLAFAVMLVAGLLGATQLDLARQITRISTIVDSITEGDGANGRFDIWAAGIREFSFRPIFGVGSNAYAEATRGYPLEKKDTGEALYAHNTYLSVLVETGMVGFLLFLGILILVARALRRTPKPQRYAWYASAAVWAVGCITSTYEDKGQTWLMLILYVLSVNVLEKVPVEDEGQLRWTILGPRLVKIDEQLALDGLPISPRALPHPEVAS